MPCRYSRNLLPRPLVVVTEGIHQVFTAESDQEASLVSCVVDSHFGVLHKESRRSGGHRGHAAWVVEGIPVVVSGHRSTGADAKRLLGRKTQGGQVDHSTRFGPHERRSARGKILCG